MRAFIENKRKGKGLTQAKMAKEIGMSRRSWQRAIDGAMTMDELVKCGKVLGFKVYLIPDNGDMTIL